MPHPRATSIRHLILLSILAISNFGFAQSLQVAAWKIDSTFATYNTKTPGVAVAVIKDGKVIMAKGYGMADLNHQIPITPQTVFNLASVSKQFTAFAIYLLESEGKLSFEDDIRQYIPEIPAYSTPIKIRHLLAHTSGLRDHGALASIAGNYYLADLNTTEHHLKLLARQKDLNFAPGSAFGYSNTNYTLLAEIIHRVTGQSFSQYVREKIFAPLGMSNTQVLDRYDLVVKNLAESYELQDGVYIHKPLMESNPGPSNVLSTVEDLSKWVLNFEQPKVGTLALLKAFNTPSYLDNGQKVLLRVLDGDSIFHAKGQNVSKDKGSYIGFGGHTAGYRTFIGRYPDLHVAIVQLSNDEDNEKLGGRWDFVDYVVSVPSLNITTPITKSASTVKPATPTYSTRLSDFTGTFSNSEVQTDYTFEVVNGALVMKHKRLYDIPLRRTGESRFNGSGSHTFAFEINFIKNSTGKTTSFDISNFGVKRLSFQKLP